jgi:hypothetical protein
MALLLPSVVTIKSRDPQCDVFTTFKPCVQLLAYALQRHETVRVVCGIRFRGGMSMNMAEVPGRWRSTRTGEGDQISSRPKSSQPRLDAMNVLNPPEPTNPVWTSTPRIRTDRSKTPSTVIFRQLNSLLF